MRKRSYFTFTDMFCGAGGTAQGVFAAGGEVLLGLNHWRQALDTYSANFPRVDLDCTDIRDTDPRRYPATDMLVASPECQAHSLASGDKKPDQQLRLFEDRKEDPAKERSRATAEDVIRFTEHHRYNMVVVENVVEFRTWVSYDEWLKEMHKLGYLHHAVYHNSMFSHPTPQSRDRMYVVFWKRGNKAPDLEFRPLAWCPRCEQDIEARQTWKDTKAVRSRGGRWGKYGSQYLYCCNDCLWKAMKKYGPSLSNKQMQEAEVMPYYYAAFNCIDWSIEGQRIGDRDKPLANNTMARIRYGLKEYGRNPLVITGRYTSGIGCRVRDAFGESLPTQPADSSHAILRPPFMVETAYSHAGEKRVSRVDEPNTAQTTRQTMAVTIPPMLVRTEWRGKEIVGIEEPHPVQTGDSKYGLVVPAFISNQYGRSKRPTSLEEPAAVMTGSNHHVLVSAPAFVAELWGTANARGLEEPLACVPAGGNHHALVAPERVRAFLSYYYGTQNNSGIDEPLGTVTTVDRAALVEMGKNIDVEDCTFRMLQPSEIQAAMAFSPDYEVTGNSRERVKQLGNAVTPPVMAMLTERCMETFH